SPVQIRHMEEHKPPYRIVAPGPVYRYEATDATHETVFHQMEGLMVDETTNIATFKGVMETFFRYLFDEEIEIRLRPSYFPFTEPSFEIDLKWPESDEWLEVFGAGMVHKQVLKNVGVNPQYQGFAFGMGIERVIMLKYGITDIRHFHSADLGFIQQF
ncbi:MAG: phenylalanine--tRNA ligase subunit alpha, partial [Candidatus Paceibacteria bacterium]